MSTSVNAHIYLDPFYVSSPAPRRDLHSFPTRRSSDLDGAVAQPARRLQHARAGAGQVERDVGRPLYLAGSRSEEHTSELQSRRELVCRLLLETKNNAAK